MRAIFGATGLNISIDPGDEDKEKLECIVNSDRHPKLTLRIVDTVEKRDCWAESGFYMCCWPPNVGYPRSTKIFVYFSKENWQKLLTVYDRESGGGWFATRCKHDRAQICYFNPSAFPDK